MTKKQITRQRIIRSAGKLFRSRGYSATGIDAIMADAGLTAGAFYSHFKSKRALFAEVVPFASKEALDVRRRAHPKSDQTIEGFFDAYLDDKHRVSAVTGCPFAALGPEIGREGETTKRMSALELCRIANHLEAAFGVKRREALPMIALAMGGLVLARLTSGRDAQIILGDCRRSIRRLARQVSSA